MDPINKHERHKDNEQNNRVVWHPHSISKNDRELIKRHKGMVLWFTGLSAAGKSTIANALEKLFNSNGYHTFLLDGDNIRHGLNIDLGFSEKDRKENIRRVSEVARLFIEAGIILIVSLISPFREDREAASDIIGKENFIEIFIDCPFKNCVSRDPKGKYKMALNAEIEDYTGVDSPYEKPLRPDIHIKTGEFEIFDKDAFALEIMNALNLKTDITK